MIGAKERRLQLVVAKFPEATRRRVRGCREAAMGRGVREALTGWRSDPHFGVVTSVCQPAGDVPGSTLGPLREIFATHVHRFSVWGREPSSRLLAVGDDL